MYYYEVHASLGVVEVLSIRCGNGDVTIDQLYVLSLVVSGARQIALPYGRAFALLALFELGEIVLLRFGRQDLLGFAGIDGHQLDVVVVGDPEGGLVVVLLLRSWEDARANAVDRDLVALLDQTQCWQFIVVIRVGQF